jgi:hypothetical protein
MAKAGEIEVVPIALEIGKCYEHVEITRPEYTRGQGFKYYTTNSPRYVGKFISEERVQPANPDSPISSFFEDNGKKNRVDHSPRGTTTYMEVPCKNSGGMRKRSRRTRRKLKTRKHRK